MILFVLIPERRSACSLLKNNYDNLYIEFGIEQENKKTNVVNHHRFGSMKSLLLRSARYGQHI
jgi:hypothetical protein